MENDQLKLEPDHELGPAEMSMSPSIALGGINSSQEPPEKIEVLIPDMFSSFLGREPRMNPYYEEVKAEALAFVTEKCGLKDRFREVLQKIDFTFFCAIIAPDADKESLRTMADWGNWIFLWDDMFDEGMFNDQPETARLMMQSLQSILFDFDSPIPKSPLVELHDSVYLRVRAKSGEHVAKRWAEGMRIYCAGALKQVNDKSTKKPCSIEEMLETRRESVGCYPLFTFYEYTNGLTLSNEFFENSFVKKMHQLATDMIVLHNDTASYCKEEGDAVEHNVLVKCRRSGLSAQGAFDQVGETLESLLREWNMVLVSVLQLDDESGGQVHDYIHGVENVLVANLNWSFHTPRYFGAKRAEVRKTCVINVLKTLPEP